MSSQPPFPQKAQRTQRQKSPTRVSLRTRRSPTRYSPSRESNKCPCNNIGVDINDLPPDYYNDKPLAK